MTRAESAGSGSEPRAPGGAPRVAIGILASRILGLVRDSVVGSLAGVGAYTDVVTAALKLPNVLQNLLGDQALSASFIPSYSRLLAEGRRRDAGALAGAMFGLMFAALGALSLLGVILAPWLVRLLAPGYAGDAEAVAAGTAIVDRLALTTTAVRICFPMAAAITLSAWCLGILNSHRRFLLPYLAPCFWNASIIAVVYLVASGAFDGEAERIESLVLAFCWGGLLGGLLQFAVQLPSVLRVAPGLRPSFHLRAPGLRKTLANLGPAIAGRGVGQLSAFVEVALASLLVQGAVGALAFGQRLYLLPMGLFAISVAAAELPELSRLRGSVEERSQAAASRARRLLATMSFLVAPTLVGYLALGVGLVAAVFRRGEFGIADNWLVFLILAAYSPALLAASASRLLQNVFFSFGDTRSPARIAAMRLAVAAGLGAALMIWLDEIAVTDVALPAWLGPAAPETVETTLRLGAVGLALGSAVGSWFELALLLRQLRRRGVPVRAPWRAWRRHLPLAIVCLVPWAATQTLVPGPPWFAGSAPALGFAATYLIAAHLLGVPEARALRRWLAETWRRQGT